MILREPRSTCCKASLSAVMCSVWRPSSPASISRWSQELDTFVTPTRSSISLSCPLVRSSRHLGTESSFSCVVWLFPRLRTLNHSQTRPFSIRRPWHLFQTPWTLRFSCAQLFAPILVASPYLISVPTRVGFVSATVPSTTSSAEWDRDPPRPTFPTLTTQCTDLLSALRSRSSPTSPQSSSTFEQLPNSGYSGLISMEKPQVLSLLFFSCCQPFLLLLLTFQALNSKDSQSLLI